MKVQIVDGYLRSYRDLHLQFDAWVVMEAQEVDYVYRWRQEAERAARALGRDGLTDDEVKPTCLSRQQAIYHFLLHLMVTKCL